MTAHRKFQFVRRPAGMPTPDVFRLVDDVTPDPGPGQVLIQSLYFSVDPYMRGRMRDIESYAPPWAVGATPEGAAVGRIVLSRRPELPSGTVVAGAWGWSEYVLSDGRGLRRLDPGAAPISTALGVLGMPGLTAYHGMYGVARPRPGDTVVVSAAAGAVGSAAGQLAALAGCRVVGVVGSPEKRDHILQDLAFDAAIDYRTAGDLRSAVQRACPDGVDVYFDNVGGPVTAAVMGCMNTFGRVAVCGQISMYNQDDAPPTIAPWALVGKRIRVEGFLVRDFEPHFREALVRLTGWVRSGKLRYRESIAVGFEKMPEALIGLFRGANLGKQLVQTAESE